MAMQRYKISLGVLKNISQMSEIKICNLCVFLLMDS